MTVVSKIENRNPEGSKLLTEFKNPQQLDTQWKALFLNLPVAVIVIDTLGFVTTANYAAKELIAKELIGSRWIDLISDLFEPKADDGEEISLKTGARIHIKTQPLPDQLGQMVTLHDVTSSRNVQEQMNQQQRLMSMGNMLASTAHQLRTPVSAALIYASHLVDSNIDNDKKQKFAVKIVNRLQVIEHQISDMLLFVKGDMPLLKPTRVSDILKKVVLATETLLQEFHASLTVNNYLGDLSIEVNSASIQNALQNLIINSIQACESHAVLELTAKYSKENSILLSLKDNGPGIPEKDKSKILQPFFTTKEQGTGLGLSVVQAVISAHKGEVVIDSKINQGTEISLILPITR